MDLAAAYRALVRKHFPQARIVADRFHVIRTVNHHFLACWKELDPHGAKNRGLLSLMRRHRHNLTMEQYAKLSDYLRGRPALEQIYRFKQRLSYLLLEKGCNQARCRKLGQPVLAPSSRPRLLRARAPGGARAYAPCLERRNRHHVALHPQ